MGWRRSETQLLMDGTSFISTTLLGADGPSFRFIMPMDNWFMLTDRSHQKDLFAFVIWLLFVLSFML